MKRAALSQVPCIIILSSSWLMPCPTGESGDRLPLLAMAYIYLPWPMNSYTGSRASDNWLDVNLSKVGGQLFGNIFPKFGFFDPFSELIYHVLPRQIWVGFPLLPLVCPLMKLTSWSGYCRILDWHFGLLFCWILRCSLVDAAVNLDLTESLVKAAMALEFTESSFCIFVIARHNNIRTWL